MTSPVAQLQTLGAKIEALSNEQENLRCESTMRQLDSGEETNLHTIHELLDELRAQWQTYYELVTLAANGPVLEEETVACSDATTTEISRITGVDTDYKWWTDVTLDESVYPSESFREQYRIKSQVWSAYSEASCRSFLDLFLQDIVGRDEFHFQLRIFCELSTTTNAQPVGNKLRKLTGKHDYIIGHAGSTGIDCCTAPRESHIIVVAEKQTWKDRDVWRCIAEAAALYRIRKDAGKRNCNVWGIRSNATLWKFVHIDNGGQVWVSEDFIYEVLFSSEAELLRVYRFLHHIMKACFEAATTATP
ncbi:hypothetical protein HDU80_007678 [Chytriomyces hyalinus]|nr:hypothetical protein HDU80_007678 [Chytriomyces hyalinus]